MVVREAVNQGKVIEINNSSFAVSRGVAKKTAPNCSGGKEQGGWVVISSDAHFCEEVGEFKRPKVCCKT
jgi:putative hydrolase